LLEGDCGGEMGDSDGMVEQGFCEAQPRACVTVLPCKAILLPSAHRTVRACKPERALQGADARQGNALSVLGALHSPSINAADRFATRKSKRDELLGIRMLLHHPTCHCQS